MRHVDIVLLTCSEEYEAALKRIEELWGSMTPGAIKELESLVASAELWENAREQV